jgi:hypothetical protein
MLKIQGNELQLYCVVFRMMLKEAPVEGAVAVEVTRRWLPVFLQLIFLEVPVEDISRFRLVSQVWF